MEMVTAPSLKRGPRSNDTATSSGGFAGASSMIVGSAGSSSLWPPIVVATVAL